mgnify:CR=1 FL=1
MRICPNNSNSQKSRAYSPSSNFFTRRFLVAKVDANGKARAERESCGADERITSSRKICRTNPAPKESDEFSPFSTALYAYCSAAPPLRLPRRYFFALAYINFSHHVIMSALPIYFHSFSSALAKVKRCGEQSDDTSKIPRLKANQKRKKISLSQKSYRKQAAG